MKSYKAQKTPVRFVDIMFTLTRTNIFFPRKSIEFGKFPQNILIENDLTINCASIYVELLAFPALFCWMI